MASISMARHLARNISPWKYGNSLLQRGLRTSTASQAAQNLRMPALSPTMTEGNISKWNVKEGDSFVAGDVLLEIETDKASMDVEAQDNGIVAKILHGDGCKGIKVGTNIGILAELGDDLKSLDISIEETETSNFLGKDGSNSQREVTATNAVLSPESSPSPSVGKVPGPAVTRSYPLLPSVQNIIHLHNLSPSDIDRITPSGPRNRLLKGDVLAYLGLISSSYPNQLSTKITKLSRLDLSNIKIKTPISPSRVTIAPLDKLDKQESMISLEQPISLEKVHEVQKKLKATLGLSLPDDVFITRATNITNKKLPHSLTNNPSPDELFHVILGQKAKLTSRPRKSHYYNPSKIYESSKSPMPVSKQGSSKKLDIIDILSGKKGSTACSLKTSETRIPFKESFILKLEVPKEDKRRALLFLGGVKTTLESNPESLVL